MLVKVGYSHRFYVVLTMSDYVREFQVHPTQTTDCRNRQPVDPTRYTYGEEAQMSQRDYFCYGVYMRWIEENKLLERPWMFQDQHHPRWQQ